ncbi:MAG: FtsX-like permease family protein, partial [Thermoplasmata archaeon]|nr:FtsX-like permease family protein [Thermoplasmata archaeon]
MTRPTSGVIGYFEKGIYQVEDDLWSIILLTGLIISLLVYCIISIETEYQASTIRILRGIGATRSHVIKIFLLKSVFITFVGGIIGTALGFCAASAVSSISGVLGIMTFVTPVASFDSIVVPIMISVGSGLVGGLWPAIRASRLFTIRRDRA